MLTILRVILSNFTCNMLGYYRALNWIGGTVRTVATGICGEFQLKQ
jgi:hypothetical protein